ncbi:MAG: hypothetical protein ACXW32_17395 [Limisphaerales bacterium]
MRDTDETINIAHQPWIAPLSYAIRLYPAAKSGWFAKYRKLHGLTIPTVVRSILSVANGLHVFGFSIYGMPPSMLKVPPMLDRSRMQCFDIGTANTSWKHAYGMQAEAFLFGGREYSDEQNCGYFLRGNTIVSKLRGGQTVGEWNELVGFLRDELKTAEERSGKSTPAEW